MAQEMTSGERLWAALNRQEPDRVPMMILAPTAGPYAAHLTERQQENTIRFIDAGHRWGRYPLQA